MRLDPRYVAPWLLVALCAAVGGCSGSRQGELLPVFPVRGRLTHQGAPMAKAVIIFFPATRGLLAGTGNPTATADGDGNYQLTTFKTSDGAPPGEYKVTIYWPEPGPEDADPLPPDRLKKAYADEKHPKLQATVLRQANELSFNLP